MTDLGEIVGWNPERPAFAFSGHWVACLQWFAMTVGHASRDREARTIGVILEAIPQSSNGDLNYRFVCTLVRNPDPDVIARSHGAVIDLDGPAWEIMLRVRAIQDAVGYVRPLMTRGFVPLAGPRSESN